MNHHHHISQIALAVAAFGALSMTAYAQPHVPSAAYQDPQAWITQADPKQSAQAEPDAAVFEASSTSTDIQLHMPRAAYLDPQAWNIQAGQGTVTFASSSPNAVQGHMPRAAYLDPESWTIVSDRNQRG